MIKVVLESPYAGDVERNLAYARLCLRHCIDMGEAPIASHLLYTQVLNDNSFWERSLGIEMGLDWARLADYAVFYTDLGWSKGMERAAEFYESINKKCEIRTLPGGFKYVELKKEEDWYDGRDTIDLYNSLIEAGAFKITGKKKDANNL